jgi:mercuric ion binding protein
MKKIFLLVLMTLSIGASAEEVQVKVSGMVCSMCAQGIQKKFSGEPSVKSLKFNMEEKLVTIHTHENKELTDQTVTKLITEAGYNVAKISRK